MLKEKEESGLRLLLKEEETRYKALEAQEVLENKII